MERLWNLEKENPFTGKAHGRLMEGAFGVSTAALVAAFFVGGHHATFSLVSAAIGAPAFLQGIVMRAVRRRTAGSQASMQRSVPEATIAELVATPERRLVRVRGTVRGSECVWRRTEVHGQILYGKFQPRYYRDVAEDFTLVDDSGRRVIVEVATALWLAPPTEPWRRCRDEELPGLLGDSEEAHKISARLDRAETRQRELRDGDPVEVVGTLSRRPDPLGSAIGRDPPTLPALTAGKQVVVVIPM